MDAWRGAAPVDDASLAVYLGELFEAGRAPATAARPRTDGRGVESHTTAQRPGRRSHTTAQRRGRLDAVIAGLLFMGGLRRSEVAAVRWADVTDARDGDGVLLTVRTSKTNQEGDAADVRYLKNGGAHAIRTVRADRPDAAPTDRVVGLSPLQIQRRFTAAARAAGIEARVTAHSGRVGLASELTARGASTTEVGGRDRRTRGRRTVFVKAVTGGRHDINTASLDHHLGMNSRCRVNGSRTLEPRQHHSTQEHCPSNASRVSIRSSGAPRLGEILPNVVYDP